MENEDEASEPEREKRAWRRLARAGDAFVGAYIVVEQFVLPAFRPLANLLLAVPPFIWIEKGAARLPPYLALAALAVPFAVAEPAKLFGLYLIGQERAQFGILVIAGAYLLSLLVVDRIYEGARPNLLTIDWFAGLMNWLVAVRDTMKKRMRKTAAGHWIRAKVRALIGAG